MKNPQCKIENPSASARNLRGQVAKDNRKGFLFVVTIFLILTYMLLSVSVWVKSIETSERSYSEFYKESNVELAMEQITDQKIAGVSSIVLNRALFVLNNQSIDHSIKAGPAGDEFRYVNASFAGWLYNGTPSASDFDDSIAPVEYSSSLSAWISQLNSSLSATGVYVDGFSIRDFSIAQTDINMLNYSYKLNLSMRDNSGAASISRTYDVKGGIDITGLPDPAIARASNGSHQILGRRFYFYGPYHDNSSVQPRLINSGTIEAGQGWFYGYLTDVAHASLVNASERKNYILVGKYTDIVNLKATVTGDVDWTQFGAYIVTSPILTLGTCTDLSSTVWNNEENTFNPIIYEGVSCTPSRPPEGVDAPRGRTIAEPFIVSAGFDITVAPYCPNPNNGTLDRQCALFVTGADLLDSVVEKKNTKPAGMGSYDLEQIRDYTLCGYYLNDANAPSYMQRLMADAYTRKSDLGISTFLIGNYVDDVIGDKYSRLDYEMFAQKPGFFVRGLPGCKDINMCGSPTPPETGIFGLSQDALVAYGLDKIACNKGGLAGCSQ